MSAVTLERFTAPRLVGELRPGERAVTWLELFYDLVFVAALIQVGQGLVDEVSPAGTVRFIILFFLLWWLWTGTTFYMNRIRADDTAHRLLVVAQMIAIGALATEVDDAFGATAPYVAVTYGIARLTIAAMYWRASTRIDEMAAVARRYALWFGVAALIWIGSAWVPSPYRFWLWGLAIAIDATRIFSRDILGSHAPGPNLEHMSERYALLTIIVLGESFIKTVGAIADHGVTTDTLVLGAVALSIAVALWWTYFDDVADSPIRATGGTRMTTVTWVYAHLPLTMGLTATGVAGEKLALGGIGQPLSPAYATLMTWSLVAVLGAISVIDAVTVNRHFAVTERDRLLPRLGAVAALLLLWPFAGTMPALVFGLLVLGIVALQIGIEDAVAKRRERRMRSAIAAAVDGGMVDEACEHLAALDPVAPTMGYCPTCVEHGMVWVALRACAACGTVGCCDDSTGRHATAHHRATGHPVITSLEADDDWAWCFVDERSLALS